MTDSPRHRLTTLNHLNRASSAVIALQLTFGGAVAFALFHFGKWAIGIRPVIGSVDGHEDPATSLAVAGSMVLMLLAANLVGLATWRLLAFLAAKLPRRQI